MLYKIKIPVGWCARHGHVCPVDGAGPCGPSTPYSKCLDFRKVVIVSAYEETDQDGQRRVYLTAPEGYTIAPDDKGLPRDPGAPGQASDNRSDPDEAR